MFRRFQEIHVNYCTKHSKWSAALEPTALFRKWIRIDSHSMSSITILNHPLLLSAWCKNNIETNQTRKFRYSLKLIFIFSWYDMRRHALVNYSKNRNQKNIIKLCTLHINYLWKPIRNSICFFNNFYCFSFNMNVYRKYSSHDAMKL